jgi:hypothetical protein
LEEHTPTIQVYRSPPPRPSMLRDYTTGAFARIGRSVSGWWTDDSEGKKKR